MIFNQIFKGDTLETLKSFPDNTFHVVVTSPPYNKSGASGGLVKAVKYQNASDTREETAYQSEQVEVLNELFRVLRPDGQLFYNHKPRLINGVTIHPLEWILKSKFKLRQEIVWDRGIAAQLRGWQFWQTDERIYWLQKSVVKGFELKSRHSLLRSVWDISPEQGYPDHPAPFPVELPTRCIYSIADERKELNILDPYCGTGSTLVAAAVMEHNYIGIDCSDEYIAIAKARLGNLMESDDVMRVCSEQNLHNVKKSYAERKKSKKVSVSKVQRHD